MNTIMSITVYVSLLLLTLSAVTSNVNLNGDTKKRLLDNGHYRYYNDPSVQAATAYGTTDGQRTILNPYDYSTRNYLPDYRWKRYNYNDLNSVNRWNSDVYRGWNRDDRYYPRAYDYNSWYYNNPWSRNYDYNQWNSHNFGNNWNRGVYGYSNLYPKAGTVYSRNFATGFRCPDASVRGYYADISSGCQVYHICQEDGRHDSFLCANGTLFNQKLLTCDHWYNVDCANSASYYYINERVGAFPRLPAISNRYK